MTTEIAVSPEITLVLSRILPQFCAECGDQLPEPGVQCVKCGKLPTLTREEAAEILSTPGALSQLKAEQATEDADAACKAFIEAAKVPDQLYAVAQLEQLEVEARAKLNEAKLKLKSAAGRVGQAKKTELRTAKDLAAAWKLADDAQNDLDAAVRTKAGPQAEKDARVSLTASQETLTGYQRDHDQATAALASAQQSESALRHDVTERESAVETAVDLRGQLADLDVGYSPDRVKLLARPLLLLSEELRKDAASSKPQREDELELVRAVIYTLADALGLTELVGSRQAEIAVMQQLGK